MADIVNLRRARKAKLRREGEKTAAANRQRFGVAKPLRNQARSEREKADRDVEGHKLEKDEER